MDPKLGIDLIPARLPYSFAQFVLDYEMVYKIPTIPELIDVLEMVKGKMDKKKGKETSPKETSSKSICFHYGQDGCLSMNISIFIPLLEPYNSPAVVPKLELSCLKIREMVLCS